MVINKVIRKTELIRVAKELNTVLGLDPQIDVNGLSLSELKTSVLEASTLIDPNDKINRKSLVLIETLKEQEPISAETESESEPVPPPEEPPEEELVEENAEEPVKPAVKQPIPKPVPAAVPATRKMTWTKALAQAIMDTKGIEFDNTGIVAECRAIYEAANNVQLSNDRGAYSQWEASKYILVDLGVLTVSKVNGLTYKYNKK